ncbi:MAG: hypothetical protein AAF653_10580 [Chloroflexota bacterium]
MVRNQRELHHQARIRRDALLIVGLRSGSWAEYHYQRGVAHGLKLSRALMYEARDWDWQRRENARYEHQQRHTEDS